MICRQANDGRFFLLLMQGEMGLGFGRKTGRSDRAVLDARLCIGVRVGSANRRDIYGLSGIAFSALLAAAKPRGWMWLLAAVTVLTAAGWYGAYDDRNRTLIAPAAEEVEQVAFRGRL